MIELICGDSMKIIQHMVRHTKGFDMIFLDPPFFKWNVKHGDKPPHNELSGNVLRLLKPNGIVWLCGTQPQLTEDWQYWRRFFTLVFELVQSKNMGTPPVNRYQPIRLHENIWCLIRKRDSIKETHLDIKRITRKGTKVRGSATMSDAMRIRYGSKWSEWREGVGYPKSVFNCKRIDKNHPEYIGHPTQKPLKLIELIIGISTIEDGWIFDPFAGSGTTLVAAKKLNRNALGIELSSEYAKLIKERLGRDWSKTELMKWMT